MVFSKIAVGSDTVMMQTSDFVSIGGLTRRR